MGASMPGDGARREGRPPAGDPGDLGTLRFLLGVVRPHRRALLGVLALLTAGSLLSMGQPLFLLLVIDRAVLGGQRRLILPLASGMLLVIALRFAVNTLHRWAFTRLSARILLDLRLPRRDGLEVLAEIKASDELRSIPAVVLTTSESEHDVTRAFAQHANSYLVKPVEFARFERLIADVEGYWLELNRQPGDTARKRAV